MGEGRTYQVALVLADARLAGQIIAYVARLEGWRHGAPVVATFEILLASVVGRTEAMICVVMCRDGRDFQIVFVSFMLSLKKLILSTRFAADSPRFGDLSLISI